MGAGASALPKDMVADAQVSAPTLAALENLPDAAKDELLAALDFHDMPIPAAMEKVLTVLPRAAPIVDPNAPPFYPVAPEDGELDKVSIVNANLLLSNWRAADDMALLSKLKVTHIAAVGTEFTEDKERGLKYWKKDIGDDEEAEGAMAASLRDAAKFIHTAVSGGGKCLVHCAAGISRSATCVLAYLVLHDTKTLREALSIVIAARRPIWPNEYVPHSKMATGHSPACRCWHAFRSLQASHHVRRPACLPRPTARLSPTSDGPLVSRVVCARVRSQRLHARAHPARVGGA